MSADHSQQQHHVLSVLPAKVSAHPETSSLLPGVVTRAMSTRTGCDDTPEMPRRPDSSSVCMVGVSPASDLDPLAPSFVSPISLCASPGEAATDCQRPDPDTSCASSVAPVPSLSVDVDAGDSTDSDESTTSDIGMTGCDRAKCDYGSAEYMSDCSVDGIYMCKKCKGLTVCDKCLAQGAHAMHRKHLIDYRVT